MKKKIIVAVDIIIAIALLLGVGYYFLSSQDVANNESEKNYEQVVAAIKNDDATPEIGLIAEIPYDKILYDPDTYSYDENFSKLELYNNALDYAGEKAGKYLWLEETQDVSNGHYGVFNMSRENIEEKIKTAQIDPETNTEEYMLTRSLTEIEEYAAALILKITDYKDNLKRDGNTELWLGYDGNANVHCFNHYNFGSESGVEETRKAKLKLSAENVNVENIILKPTDVENGEYTAVVSADISCLKNSGVCKDVEWIPKKGEKRNVTFIVRFYGLHNGETSYNFTSVGIVDMFVRDYKDII